METMIQQTKRSSWSKSEFRSSIHPISEFPLLTADDLEYEKDPEAHEQRELRKLWKEERSEFKRLERLALGLGIRAVIVTPASPLSISGCYIPEGYWESDLAEKWELSKKQDNSIGIGSRPTILICRDTVYSEGACRFLAHEIGHHICRRARFTFKQLNAPVTKMMRRFFPDNAYLKEQNSQDEFHAECFAEYLTVFALRCGIERECEAILSRVRRHYPEAASLVEQYRKMLLK